MQPPSRHLPAAVLALLAAAPLIARAEPAAPAAALPRAFAGYAQPALGAGACKAVNAGETRCQFPAMTAGRYRIEAAGTSSSPQAGANQVLQIDVGGQRCGVGRDSGAWKGGPRTFRLDCEVTVLTDTPLGVRVVYADANAVRDPKGPAVTIVALPWSGVLAAQAFAPPQ
jgi:hypothetical protein